MCTRLRHRYTLSPNHFPFFFRFFFLPSLSLSPTLSTFFTIMGSPSINEIQKPDPNANSPIDSNINNLLVKSIALHLKLLLRDSNVKFSKIAFLQLIDLIKFQLNDLIKNLNRIMLLQRRLLVSNDDLNIWLNGYNIHPYDLYKNIQLNNFLKDERLNSGYGNINSNTTNIVDFILHPPSHSTVPESTSTNIDNLLRDQILINKHLNLNNLIPNDTDTTSTSTSNKDANNTFTNPIFNCNINLPELPPDHTYKFTPQFTNFVTDERIIKKNLFNESKIGELTLLHYLTSIKNYQNDLDYYSLNEDTTPTIVNDSNDNSKEKEEEEEEEKQQQQHEQIDDEMLALFGSVQSNTKSYINHDFNFYYNRKSFDIAKYSQIRINLEKKRVENFELNSIMNTKNPIFNLIHELKQHDISSNTSKDDQLSENDSLNEFRIKTSFDNKKINGILEDDLNKFIMSQRSLRAKKKIVMKKAIKERDKRISQIREHIIERERKENELKTLALLKNQQLANSKVLEKVKSVTPDLKIPNVHLKSSIIPTEILVGGSATNANGDEDDDELGLFGGLESSDDNDESIPNTHGTNTTNTIINEKTLNTSNTQNDQITNNSLPDPTSDSTPTINHDKEINKNHTTTASSGSISIEHTLTEPPELIKSPTETDLNNKETSKVNE
ncbi:Taf8p PWA37_001394 [Arxiozyma heterogenica]|uniref:Taf8p n=1 Tax=Arxiozyma heterogenica TaxID=278026 RepID=UPI002EE6BA25